jgi:hypothetical protein
MLLKQEIFQHIGGYWLVIELLDKAFNVVDANMLTFEKQDSRGKEE